jgi:hypothetical protein
MALTSALVGNMLHRLGSHTDRTRESTAAAIAAVFSQSWWTAPAPPTAPPAFSRSPTYGGPQRRTTTSGAVCGTTVRGTTVCGTTVCGTTVQTTPAHTCDVRRRRWCAGAWEISERQHHACRPGRTKHAWVT